jgi:hypothetical protein
MTSTAYARASSMPAKVDVDHRTKHSLVDDPGASRRFHDGTDRTDRDYGLHDRRASLRDSPNPEPNSRSPVFEVFTGTSRPIDQRAPWSPT